MYYNYLESSEQNDGGIDKTSYDRFSQEIVNEMEKRFIRFDADADTKLRSVWRQIWLHVMDEPT